MTKIDYDEFKNLFLKYVYSGMTPVIVCRCGYMSWMFEGDAKYTYENYILNHVNVAKKMINLFSVILQQNYKGITI